MKKVIAPKTEKYLTISVFEKHMGSIARSFEDIDRRLNRHDELFERMFSMLQDVQESNREIRNDIRSFLHSSAVSERRVDDLTERVEVLERKPATI